MISLLRSRSIATVAVALATLIPAVNIVLTSAARADVNIRDEWTSVAVEHLAALDDPVPCIGDGSSGKRVEVIYAYAQDASSRYAQFLSTIRKLVANVNREFSASAGETKGERQLRLVTSAGGGCDVVVHDVHLGVAGNALTFDSVTQDLAGQGFQSSNRIYLVYIDGDIPPCGVSGNGYALIDGTCWSDVDDHELTHSLGAVYGNAPHADKGGGHCWDEWDPMCVTSDFKTYGCPWWHHDLPDCKHDDYFNTDPKPGSFLAKHPEANTAKSPYLASLPALNDDFADAEPVGPGVIWGSNVGTGTEPSEPNAPGEGSIWYHLNADAGKKLILSTYASSADTVLTLYKGTSLTDLTKVDQSDDAGQGVHYSRVKVNSTQDVDYFIRIASKNGRGSVRLNVSYGDVIPNITGMTPHSGRAGTTIEVKGSGLYSAGAGGFVVTINGFPPVFGSTQVTLDGVSMDVDTYNIPGPVTFATEFGQDFTDAFKVLPKINSFSPASAKVGDKVHVHVDNEVSGIKPKFFVGGERVHKVRLPGAGTATLTVPNGANTGPIKMKTSGGTAKSKDDFKVKH